MNTKRFDLSTPFDCTPFEAPAPRESVMALTLSDLVEISEAEAELLDFDSAEAQLAALKGSW